jgi:hypothetical protein
LLFAAANPAMTAWEGSISASSNTGTCHMDTFGSSCNDGPFDDDYKISINYATNGDVRGHTICRDRVLVGEGRRLAPWQ